MTRKLPKMGMPKGIKDFKMPKCRKLPRVKMPRSNIKTGL
jgi:hypothetical protein